MKKKFIEWKPSGNSSNLIDKSNEILDDYNKQGYILTLRQLYYQLVSRDIIANKVKSYTMLGNIISNGRLAGLIDWEMIEDRSRSYRTNSHWNSPKEILDAAASSYYLNRWEDQHYYVEVWCEKDAVSNILQPVCSKWDVLFMANRGYSSQSAMYNAYQRIYYKIREGKKIKIIYFGDHDPSGIDMTRDIEDRLGTFLFSSFEDVNRVALNLDQVKKYNPPENPAKSTDSRYQSYIEKFGYSSWELDALEPKILADLVEKTILKYVDLTIFKTIERKEKEEIQFIKDIAEREFGK